jgi:hypothetical protein
MHARLLSLVCLCSLAFLGSARAWEDPVCREYTISGQDDVKVQDNTGFPLSFDPRTNQDHYVALWNNPAKGAYYAQPQGADAVTSLRLDGMQGQFLFRITTIFRVSSTVEEARRYFFWVDGNSICRGLPPLQGAIRSVDVLKVVYKGGVYPS